MLPCCPSHFCCVKVGDLVYARVESAHRDLEPVLSCTDAAGKVSGEPATKELARRHNPSCQPALHQACSGYECNT